MVDGWFRRVEAGSGFFVLTSDYSFSSASAAAVKVIRASANERILWRLLTALQLGIGKQAKAACLTMRVNWVTTERFLDRRGAGLVHAVMHDQAGRGALAEARSAQCRPSQIDRRFETGSKRQVHNCAHRKVRQAWPRLSSSPCRESLPLFENVNP
jgi:hypothetical protein